MGSKTTPLPLCSIYHKRSYASGPFFLLVGLLACLLSISLDVNAQFTFDAGLRVERSGSPSDLAIGDFDNNGFKDMAYVAPWVGKVHVLYNSGTYTYTTSATDAGGFSYDYRLAAADFNEDGKSDLALVNRNNPVNERLIIFLSTGTSFTKTSFSIPGPSDIYSISTADFDNDGHADVVVPNIGQILTWYKGNGQGGFSQETYNTVIGGNSLVVAEFNNDAKLDFAIGRGQQVDVYLSSGATFSKTTVGVGSSPSYLIATDVNNDGSKDIVGSFSNSTIFIARMMNNGSGGFSGLTLIPSSSSASSRVASADYNGDGLHDLAVATYNGTGPAILLNTGGSYTGTPFTDERVNEVSTLAFADLDNTGDPELVCLSGFPSLSVIKRVSGVIQLTHKEILGNIPSRGLTRDVDHDGNYDLLNASISNGVASLKRGNGDMTFDKNEYLLGAGYRVEYVDAADFNADGFDDVLFVETYLNGTNKFKLSLTNAMGQYQNPVEISQATGNVSAVGDFNLDGKQDFFCRSGVFLGNGAGSFTFQSMSHGLYPYFVKVAKLNNDNAPDLVIGDGVNAWTMLNNGSGGFAAPVTLTTPRRVSRLDVGPYDTDNLTDIFTISDNNTFSAFKNLGTGAFQEYFFSVQQPLTISSRYVFTMADFNKDGRGDFAIHADRNNGGGAYVQKIAVYVQGQNNTFKLKMETATQLEAPFDMTVADMNNDGSLDLIGFSVFEGIEVIPGYFLPEPTTQAGPINILDRTDVTVKLGFAAGTGDGRIVVLRKNTFPIELPEDDLFYAANSQFGQGANVGNNNFVVLRGNPTEVTITGLQAGTDYIATLFEYSENLGRSVNNYRTSDYASVAFKTKSNQTISFPAVTAKTEGNAPFTVTATSSSGLAVAYSSLNTNITLNLSEVTILGPGSVTITANQGGNSDYMPAPAVSTTFCVNPVQPTFTVTESAGQKILTSSRSSNNQWMLNGQAIPGATGTTHQATLTGTYAVKVDFDGCSATSTPDVVTGLEELAGVLVSPNPASHLLILHGLEVNAVTMTSSQGQQFHLAAKPYSGESRVDVSSVSAGLYILSAGNGFYRRVLINR